MNSVPGVFAGGEETVIRRAAEAIDEYLNS